MEAYFFLILFLGVGLWLSYQLYMALRAGRLRVNFILIERHRWYFFWPVILIFATWAILSLALGTLQLLALLKIIAPLY